MEIYTKISKRKDLKWSRRNRGKFAPRMGCANFEGVMQVLHKLRTSWRCCASVVRVSHKLKVLCEFQGVVRISHKPRAVVFRRPYLPHFSSKLYTVWSVGFLTSWALKWYIACRKWTLGSAPKVRRKTAAAVLCFLHSVCFSSLLPSFTWLVLMIQKAVKTLKLATNMIRSHC